MLIITIILQAAVGGLQNAVGGQKQMLVMWISDCLTHKFWFSRFMAGIQKCVGQIQKPDKEISIDIIHAVDRILEMEWQNSRRSEEKKKIAKMGAWFIGGFCTGLRGEEMVLIKLAGMADSLLHINDDTKKAHLVFVVKGRTKANQRQQEQSLECHAPP
jgi:hypothetical protein